MESFSYWGRRFYLCAILLMARGGINDLSESGDPSRQIETVTRTCKQAHVNDSTVSRLAWVRLHAEAAAQGSWIIGKQCAGLLSDFFFFSLSFCHSWGGGGCFPWGMCFEQLTYTSPPLADSWAASLWYIEGTYTCKLTENAGTEKKKNTD